MNIKSENGCVVVSFDKDITGENLASIKEEIDNAYSFSNAQSLVFDYSKTKKIGEDDINFALGRYKRVHENMGRMYISGAKGDVKKTLESKGIYNVIGKLDNPKEII